MQLNSPIAKEKLPHAPPARLITRRRLFIVGATLLFVAIVAALVVGRLSERILETEKIRTLIAAKTGRELGGPAGLLPINAHGFSVVSRGLVVTAQPPRALSELRIDELSARFSLIELWRGKWRIDRLHARHAQVAYGAVAAKLLDRSEFPAPEMVPPSQTESPMSVDIRQVSIAHTDIYWGDPATNGGQFRDVESTYYPDRKNLRIQGRGGTFHQAKFPEARVKVFKLYYARPTLRIDEGQLALGRDGAIDVAGNLNFEQKASLDFRLKFDRCPIKPFLSEGQAKRLEGTFHGDTHIQKQMGNDESLAADGTIAVEKVVVKNVAALSKAAAFTGKSQLDPLHMDEVRGDYRWDSGQLTVRDFRAQANQLLCLRGSFTFKDGAIAGRFELGVAPEIVAKFPGAREDVFTREENGYLWTSLKLSGPLDHPQDDLKPRLMRAVEKHFLGGILEPLIKPAQAAREIIDLIFPQ